MSLDLILKNVRGVRPEGDGAGDLNIGDGRVRPKSAIPAAEGKAVHDAGGVIGDVAGKHPARPTAAPAK